MYNTYHPYFFGEGDISRSMLFNSLAYLIFLPTTIILYFLLPQKFRWGLLLFASYFFYMCWKPEYIVLILASTCIDYFAAIGISKTNRVSKKRLLLLASLLTNLGLLFAFKYFNFFSHSLGTLAAAMGQHWTPPAINVLLPVGISFYTFQTLSYTIDVYKGVRGPERHFGYFALYVSFFPQLVAGPIERSERLLPQLRAEHSFNFDRMLRGGRQILWGYFKKIVIADNLAIIVNTVYSNPQGQDGFSLIVATLCFAFQIYCDFSGYSDIAIGSARVMGVELMQNFNMPYFSRSIGEFWHRWHISLSTWFRDYVYIPLGGNRVKKGRYYLNLFITFVLSGLWHGANWTFLLWGALHGAYMVIGTVTRKFRSAAARWIGIARVPKLYHIFQVIVTFGLVCFAWIFFRANSLQDAWYVTSHLFDNIGRAESLSYIANTLNAMGFNAVSLAGCIISVGLLQWVDFLSLRKDFFSRLDRRSRTLRWGFYYIVLCIIFTLGVFYDASEFIYFQF